MFYDLILLLNLLFVDFLTVIFYVMMVVATLYKPNINADAKHIWYILYFIEVCYSSAVLRSWSIFDRLRVFFLQASAPAPAPIKKKVFKHKKKFWYHSFFLTRKISFIHKYSFLNSLLSMWELTKRISLRTSSVLSKVEPEPDLNTGSDQKVPVATIVSDPHSLIPGQDPTMGLLLTVPTWPPLLFPQNWTVRNRALIRPKRLLLEQTGHF